MSSAHPKELAPPVFMRHMHHTKDPLPAIGHFVSSSAPPPSSKPTNGDSPPHSGSPDAASKALDESPQAVVGSLAVARRRARNANGSLGVDAPQAHFGRSPQRSPSPPEADPVPLRSRKVDQNLLDVLDPDADGTEQVVLTHDDELTAGRPKATHRTSAALMDVLDPDADGSTIVDLVTKSAGNSSPVGAAPPIAAAGGTSQQQQRPPVTSAEAPNPFHRGFR